MTHRLLFLALLLNLGQSLYAQLNVKVGYEMVFIQPDGTNAAFDAYNEQNSWITDRFKEVNYLHGLHTGLRFQLKPLAWEVNYSKRFNTRQVIGNDPDFGLETTRKIIYDVELISLVQEIQFGSFGVGGSIDYNWLDIRSEVVNQEDGHKIGSDEAWSSQFYLVFHTSKTGFISLSIQPYFQVYWDTLDVSPISQELKVNVGKEREDNLSHFGVKFIFYNGK